MLFQECPLVLEEWFEKKRGYKLLFYDKDTPSNLALTSFYQSGHWLVQEPVTCSVQKSKAFSVQEIVCNFKFRREPLFYIIVIFMPSVFLTVLSFSLFFLPISGGEKVATSLTILLSLVVELLVVSDLLPATGSTDLPILAELLINLVTLVFLCSLESVVVTCVYAKQTPLPNIISKLLNSKLVTFLGFETSCESDSMSGNGTNEAADVSMALGVDQSLTQLERREAEFGTSWRLLAQVIDRVCLLLYCSFVLMTLIYYTITIRKDLH